MTDPEKERMIELLIESFEEYGESEGIFGVDGDELLELLQLLIKYGHKPEEHQKHHDWLVIEFERRRIEFEKRKNGNKVNT